MVLLVLEDLEVLEAMAVLEAREAALVLDMAASNMERCFSKDSGRKMDRSGRLSALSS